jgi:hypothetical protein
MKGPTVCTIVAFMAFAVGQIYAQDLKEQLRKLPVCAVSRGSNDRRNVRGANTPLASMYNLAIRNMQVQNPRSQM